MSTSVEPSEDQPPKEVQIVDEEDIFIHKTGDIYNGWFQAKKKDMIVRMHGRGVYTTAEGDRYSGRWDSNLLGAGEEVTLDFNDGSRYIGTLKDWTYSGKGRYIYPDETVLMCDFSDNCPIGPLTITDPNGHAWLGKSEPGFTWFEPVNHYYGFLEKPEVEMKARASTISGKKKSASAKK